MKTLMKTTRPLCAILLLATLVTGSWRANAAYEEPVKPEESAEKQSAEKQREAEAAFDILNEEGKYTDNLELADLNNLPTGLLYDLTFYMSYIGRFLSQIIQFETSPVIRN